MNATKNTSALFMLLIAILFSSCGQDYLTKTIEFEDIGFEPAMVLNAKVSSIQDSLYISISKNINYAQNANPSYAFINGVSLELEVDGVVKYQAEEIAIVTNDTVRYNYLIVLDENPISGKEYTIKATHPDYPSIQSTIFLPTPSEPQNIEFEVDARTSVIFFQPISQDLVSFDIVDNPNEENYYLFQVKTKERQDTFIFENAPGVFDTAIINIGSYPIELEVEYLNAIIVDNNTMLLSDRGFNGKTISIDLYSFSYDFEDNKKRTFEYRNISKSDYEFRQSYETYRNAQNIGIFAEPVTLFSNVEGGFGLFSGEDLFSYDLE